MTAVFAWSVFWGGDGDAWLAILAIVLLPILSLVALWQARDFVKRI